MREQTFARMLFYTLWYDGGGFPSYDAGLDYLRGYQFVCSEVRQVVRLGVAASKHAAKSLGAGLQHVPLMSHATYRREEVLAALQYGSLELGKNVKHREGVVWCPATSTDAFFGTLNKDDKKHSATTLYHEKHSATTLYDKKHSATTLYDKKHSATTLYKDYAISPELFHWESQSTTPAHSPVARRYLVERLIDHRFSCSAETPRKTKPD